MEKTMDTYEGRCKYCGDIQPVMAMDQIDADEKISECCKCDGAKMEKKKQQLMENLDYTIGASAVNQGFQQVTDEQEELITNMAMAVLYGKISKATCQIKNTTVMITMSAGKCKVNRIEKKAMSLEV